MTQILLTLILIAAMVIIGAVVLVGLAMWRLIGNVKTAAATLPAGEQGLHWRGDDLYHGADLVGQIRGADPDEAGRPQWALIHKSKVLANFLDKDLAGAVLYDQAGAGHLAVDRQPGDPAPADLERVPAPVTYWWDNENVLRENTGRVVGYISRSFVAKGLIEGDQGEPESVTYHWNQGYVYVDGEARKIGPTISDLNQVKTMVETAARKHDAGFELPPAPTGNFGSIWYDMGDVDYRNYVTVDQDNIEPIPGAVFVDDQPLYQVTGEPGLFSIRLEGDLLVTDLKTADQGRMIMIMLANEALSGDLEELTPKQPQNPVKFGRPRPKSEFTTIGVKLTGTPVRPV